MKEGKIQKRSESTPSPEKASAIEGTINESVYLNAHKLSSEQVKDSQIKKLWKDPVISKLIAAGIIFLMPLISAIFIKILNNKPFWNSVSEVFNFKLKIWVAILFLVGVIALLFLAIFIKIKFFKTKYYFPFDEPIGSFRFFEIYNILLERKHKLPLSFALQSVTPDASLLLLFMFYTPMLNMGVDWDSPGGEQGDFVFYKLGPILISYGLCEKVISLNKIGETEVWAIQTSDTGRKFFAWAEKYRTFEEYVNAKNKKSKTTTNKVHDNHVS